MSKLSLAVVMSAFGCLFVPYVQAEERAPANSQTRDATLAAKLPAYQLVENLIKDPRLLEKPWSQMRKAFPDGCTKQGDEPKLKCPPMEGVVWMAANASGTGIVDVVFTNPITCDALYEIISRRFGPGSLEDNNKCFSDWALDRWVKRGHLRLDTGRKDPTKIFFQMAIGQGP